MAEEHEKDLLDHPEAVDKADREKSRLSHTMQKDSQDVQERDSFADGVETESGGGSDTGNDTGDEEGGTEDRKSEGKISKGSEKISQENSGDQHAYDASLKEEEEDTHRRQSDRYKEGEDHGERDGEDQDRGGRERTFKVKRSLDSRRHAPKKGPSPGAVEVAARLFVAPLLRFLKFRMVRNTLST